MTNDTGRSPDGSGSRASHEAANASSPEASIPNAANETADGGCIICPHCAEEMGDCWEWVHDEPTENECSYCQKKIIVWAEYDVTYRARVA